MNDYQKLGSAEMKNLFQEITGSYYLIPNIKKYLKRTLEMMNHELSLIASVIFYMPPNEKNIILSMKTNGNQSLGKEKIMEFSKTLFNENYSVIDKTKRVFLEKDLQAYIIPILCEFKDFGLMLLFGDCSSICLNEAIVSSIGTYITAACVGHYLIYSNGSHGVKNYQEISVRKLLEWRIQEIAHTLLKESLPKQNIFQEISRETERTLIKSALDYTGNNQSRAANFLGINRNTLRKKIKEFEIL